MNEPIFSILQVGLTFIGVIVFIYFAMDRIVKRRLK